MSDAPKLLTLEEVKLEASFEWDDGVDMTDALIDYVERANATVKAACERLARMESCSWCGGRGEVAVFGPPHVSECPHCHGTGFAHKNWQAALRKLGSN